MEYEGQICRPPMERSSFMLGVSVGCAYNQCKFCNLFKHLSYRLLPLEQIEAELARVRSIGGDPHTVFLGDGNAFGIRTERLMAIIDMVHHYFPACEMINMDATVTDISRKTDEELKLLQKAGVRHLYLGIESGLDDVLKEMNKDHTLAEAYREIDRLQQAGMIFDAHIMTGIAGSGRSRENAAALAEFFNRTQPSRIINFSLFVSKGTALYQDAADGLFKPASELENLQEEHTLLQLLEVPGLYYDGFHDYIKVRVRGTLPADRQKMLAKLDQKISVCSREKPLIAFA